MTSIEAGPPYLHVVRDSDRCVPNRSPRPSERTDLSSKDPFFALYPSKNRYAYGQIVGSPDGTPGIVTVVFDRFHDRCGKIAPNSSPIICTLAVSDINEFRLENATSTPNGARLNWLPESVGREIWPSTPKRTGALRLVEPTRQPNLRIVE